jgi:signal transduction histidine kinase
MPRIALWLCSSAAKLELSADERDGVIVIVVRDNGRGVDWDAVRSRAESLRLAARSRTDLEHARPRAASSGPLIARVFDRA